MIIDFAFRILRRHRGKLFLTTMSLAIGALSLVVVLGATGSIRNFLALQSRELTGGDISLESASTGTLSRISTVGMLKSVGAKISNRVEILSLARGVGEGNASSTLISLTVVDGEYPLFGSLETLPEGGVGGAGEVVVAETLLTRLGVKLGDTIAIGQGEFVISRTIVREPDTLGGSFRLGPSVILSESAFRETGIDSTGSRASYITRIRYPEGITEESQKTYEQALTVEVKSAGVRMSTAENGPRSLTRILETASQFFLVITMLVLCLVVVNIRVDLEYLLASFTRTVAVFRALGMRKSQLLAIFHVVLLVIALVGGVIGAILGNTIVRFLTPVIGELIGGTLTSPGIGSYLVTAVLFSVALCELSALSFHFRMIALEPKQLLGGFQQGGRKRMVWSEMLVFVLLFIVLFVMLWVLTKSLQASLLSLCILGGIFGVLLFLIRYIILLFYRGRARYPFVIRASISFLNAKGMVGVIAIASLIVALTCVFGVALLERNILGNLAVDFRADAPNFYAIDVQPDQREGVAQLVGEQWKDFAMIRARFTKRDGVEIQSQLDQEDPEMRREFNVTGRSELIDGETVVSGSWHGEQVQNAVSIEEGFASRAKLVLGSRVIFVAQGIPLEATVTSIRKVNETSGLPFFFLVFSPDVVKGLPSSTFGYSYVPEEHISELQNSLAQRYPNVTTIRTSEIITSVSRIVKALSTAIISTALPAILLGLLLLFVQIALAVRERSNDVRVMVAYGAKRSFILRLFLVESLVSICLASGIALLLAHIGVYFLIRDVFHFTGHYGSQLVWFIVLGAIGTTVVVSSYFARNLVRTSPTDLLRKP